MEVGTPLYCTGLELVDGDTMGVCQWDKRPPTEHQCTFGWCQIFTSWWWRRYTQYDECNQCCKLLLPPSCKHTTSLLICQSVTNLAQMHSSRSVKIKPFFTDEATQLWTQT